MEELANITPTPEPPHEPANGARARQSPVDTLLILTIVLEMPVSGGVREIVPRNNLSEKIRHRLIEHLLAFGQQTRPTGRVRPHSSCTKVCMLPQAGLCSVVALLAAEE